MTATTDNMHLLPFYPLFSVVMIVILHGSSAIKVLIILALNYVIARVGKGANWVVAATWMFNGAVLFANERYSGYRFADMSPGMAFLVRHGVAWTDDQHLMQLIRTAGLVFIPAGMLASISPCLD